MDSKFMIGAFGAEQWILIALLVVMVVVLIVLPMFTNKRRNKAVNELYNSIRPGDIIKTVGGIIGEVKEIKELSPVDKQMVIETGAEGSKTTMVFDIQAVYQVIDKVAAPTPIQPTETVATEPVAETPAPVEAAQPISEETAAADAPEEKKEEVVEETAPAEKDTAAKTGAANKTRSAGSAKGKSTASKK